MRARFPAVDSMLLCAHVELSPEIDRVRRLNASFAAADPDAVETILDSAATFAEAYLADLNDTMDSAGCLVAEGRVKTVAGHHEAWNAYVEAGWPTLDQHDTYGGQGLPRIVATAVQEIFDRTCPAFGMLPVNQRSAARLISAWAPDDIKAAWLPMLVSGEWGSTICISEAEAGSDVGRIRTLAQPNRDGSWSITGEKCWISFGDQDLTSRIGHCVLARTPGAAVGGAGLSLFLVPDRVPNRDGTDRHNNVLLRRIEEKMGLHGSPTCALGFEGSAGWLLGEEGRGLSQMFVMITNMRLAVGVMGLGIAGGCCDLAFAYAHERLQGGSGAKPVPIAHHVDVQRQLLEMASKVEAFRGLEFALCNFADLAEYETDAGSRREAEALTQWLLPIVKTTGGEVAFDVADAAIQVLGGAGYTRHWPVEQAMRDARVLTVFEGTTGIQGLDLLYRRLLRPEQTGLSVFLKRAREACRTSRAAGARKLSVSLDILEDTASFLIEASRDIREAQSVATAFLHLASLTAMGWIALRLAGGDATGQQRRLHAAGAYWLSDIDHKARFLSAKVKMGYGDLALFSELEPRS